MVSSILETAKGDMEVLLSWFVFTCIVEQEIKMIFYRNP